MKYRFFILILWLANIQGMNPDESNPDWETVVGTRDIDIIAPTEKKSALDDERQKLRQQYERIRDRFYNDFRARPYNQIPRYRIDEVKQAKEEWEQGIRRIKKQLGKQKPLVDFDEPS